MHGLFNFSMKLIVFTRNFPQGKKKKKERKQICVIPHFFLTKGYGIDAWIVVKVWLKSSLIIQHKWVLPAALEAHFVILKQNKVTKASDECLNYSIAILTGISLTKLNTISWAVRVHIGSEWALYNFSKEKITC